MMQSSIVILRCSILGFQDQVATGRRPPRPLFSILRDNILVCVIIPEIHRRLVPWIRGSPINL
jgi:hypothetical protein